MIYLRAQISKMGTMHPMFDVTIRNTGDSRDAGSEDSKIGNYDVTLREQDNCAVTKTKVGRIEGFPRKTCDGADLIFLALYSALGKERCNALLKKMKKGTTDAKTKRKTKEVEGRVIFGRRTRAQQ